MKQSNEWHRMRGAPRVGLRVRVKSPDVRYATSRHEGVIRSLEGCGFVLVAPDYPDPDDLSRLWKTHAACLLERTRARP